MEKRVYVIGHRNPDTDSVVSAAAYARLKQQMGQDNCIAARAGKINPQTEYIFNRFKMPVPEFLPDLIPKVGYYISEKPETVHENTPLWQALEKMQAGTLKVLPIVDSNGIYKSLLHYNAFSKYILTKVNPHQKSGIPTSVSHLLKTLQAQPLTVFNETEVRKSPIVVAASSNNTFQKYLDAEMPDNTIVIAGDRTDIHRYSIEQKVRALVITNGNTLDKELVDLARENQVSVMISPFDTSSTTLLIIYSTPVGSMGDASVPLIRLGDPVRKIRDLFQKAPSRNLPVGDDEGKVAGILFEGDLMKEPNVEVIMVDHNEPSQAIEGIENYKILEVIDHHRLGNLSTRYPITFINKVVGATSTIITNLYRETRIPLDRPTASILLCGILADTLVLKSATTTVVDQEAAEYLSSITGIDLHILGQELLAEASKINTRTASELINMDMKEYSEESVRFTVSQIETESTRELVQRKEEITAELGRVRRTGDRLFSALMVTDVTELNSILFVEGDKAFTSHLNFPQIEDGIFILKDMVSRKKQLIPLLSELVEVTIRESLNG